MKGEFYRMEYEAWDEGTDTLTLEQEAAYLRICHQMYRRRGAIPNHLQTLARIWRCHPNKARTLLAHLVDQGKITVTPEGHLTQTRVRHELDHRETVSRQRADAGKTGGRPRRDLGANPLKNMEPGEAFAFTPEKQKKADKSRVEEIRGEERREEEIEVSSEPEYAIENGIIRLTQKDLEKLQSSYPHVNVLGEIEAASSWLMDQHAGGKNWFVVAKAMLNKKNNACSDRFLAIKATAEAEVKSNGKPRRPLV